MTESLQHKTIPDRAADSYLGLYAGLLVIVIIALLVIFSFMNVRYQKQIQLIEYVNTQQVIASRIGSDIGEISNSNITEGISSLGNHSVEFEETLGLVKKSLSDASIYKDADLDSALHTTIDVWDKFKVDINTILEEANSLRTLLSMLDEIRTSIPEIMNMSQELIDNLVENKADARDVYVATRQLVLIQRIENGIDEVSRAGLITDDERLKTYQNIGRDSAIFEQSLQEMSHTRQSKASNLDIRDKILQVFPHYQHVSESIVNILRLEPDLTRVNLAVRNLTRSTPSFLQASQSLAKSGTDGSNKGMISPLAWAMLGGGLLILISLMVMQARINARKSAAQRHEVTPRELVDYLYDMVGDIAKAQVSGGKRIQVLPASPFIKEIGNALLPVRKRTEFIRQTAAKMLSIANGMHKSVVDIVDFSDGFAQQLNRSGGILEDLNNAMRRALNDAVTIREILTELRDHPGVPGVAAAEARLENAVNHIRERFEDIKLGVRTLGDNVPEVSEVAERIRIEASKINLIALNTAIQANGDGMESIEVFAADEIQQHSHRISGTARHLAEIGEVFESTVSRTVEKMTVLTGAIENLPALQMDNTETRQEEKSAAIMFERIQNVVTVLERQLDAANEAASSLAALHETIVGLSAGINDIMAGVEMLEKLSMELKGSW
jgi:twitching motility protein PilJ